MSGIQLEAEGCAPFLASREKWPFQGGCLQVGLTCHADTRAFREGRDNQLLPGRGTKHPGVHSRGIEPLHPSVVADAVGAVSQVVTLVIDAVGRLLVGQVLLHLVLGCPVGPSTHREQLSLGTCRWDSSLLIAHPCSSQLGSDVLPRASLPSSHAACMGFMRVGCG